LIRVKLGRDEEADAHDDGEGEARATALHHVSLHLLIVLLGMIFLMLFWIA
jgi:hypothetical protein